MSLSTTVEKQADMLIEAVEQSDETSVDNYIEQSDAADGARNEPAIENSPRTFDPAQFEKGRLQELSATRLLN